MFCDNLKTIRKLKGMTQEELAIKTNVVRQTVSKWEKGLSVPDVEMTARIADALGVSIGELLGAEIRIDESDRNQVANQLGKIVEQMAIRNRRSRKIWRTIAAVLLCGALLTFLAAWLFSARTGSGGVDRTCVVEETISPDA